MDVQNIPVVDQEIQLVMGREVFCHFLKDGKPLILIEGSALLPDEIIQSVQHKEQNTFAVGLSLLPVKVVCENITLKDRSIVGDGIFGIDI